MNRKTVIINIYNFIRMSHTEPSRFIADDFETVRRELTLVKQYGFPGTYALKYDALMEPRYQALLGEFLDENDELSAWWEITEPLCRRAGVRFRGHAPAEEYDDRVDSAYCVGYTPEERKKLVDAYMADFYAVFGKYPQTIGSWVLDSVTLQYAGEKYGLVGGAICRDQMGTDGFTLWGGLPNGIYYPSKKNEFIPAQTRENQIDLPVFRLLGPDPIYNFEADVRSGLQGVYTLEPCWLTGRDPKWLSWFFSRLTEEDTLGIGYAQVGQENNFLWENIQPGLGPQLGILEALTARGLARVETMAASARWFRQQYRLTPPMTFQASFDWDETRGNCAMWYACDGYRLGILGEKGRLRIRDLFLYDENYPSRYLNGPIKGVKSTFDALPVLSPQLWGMGEDCRPFLRLVDARGREPEGKAEYAATGPDTARAVLRYGDALLARLDMTRRGLTLTGPWRLRFDYLPQYSLDGRRIGLRHNGYPFSFRVALGEIHKIDDHSLDILPEAGEISLAFRETEPEAYPAVEAEIPAPPAVLGEKRPVPPMAPLAAPEDAVFPWGTAQTVTLSARDGGQIRFTTDGSEPAAESPLYREPLTLDRDTVLRAALFLPDGTRSETADFHYRFGWKDMILESPTAFDPRPVFHGNGVFDLLRIPRANTDFLCSRWLGTLEDLDVTGRLPRVMEVARISMGFLSHHRGGIVLPEAVELYTGPDPEHLALRERRELPCEPGPREIFRQDVEFRIGANVGAFRLVARRYAKMPQWCCYRGSRDVFTMADCLILVPGETL